LDHGIGDALQKVAVETISNNAHDACGLPYDMATPESQ